MQSVLIQNLVELKLKHTIVEFLIDYYLLSRVNLIRYEVIMEQFLRNVRERMQNTLYVKFLRDQLPQLILVHHFLMNLSVLLKTVPEHHELELQLVQKLIVQIICEILFQILNVLVYEVSQLVLQMQSKILQLQKLIVAEYISTLMVIQICELLT